MNSRSPCVHRLPTCVLPGLAPGPAESPRPHGPSRPASHWPRLTRTADLLLPPAPWGLLGMCTPFQIPGELTSQFTSWNKLQLLEGWAWGLGWGLTEAELSFQVLPAHLEFIPWGRGAERESGRQTDRQTG